MLPLPEDAEAAITSLRQLASETEASLQGVLHAARKFMDRSAAYAASLQELNDAVNAWSAKTVGGAAAMACVPFLILPVRLTPRHCMTQTPIVEDMPDALEVSRAHANVLLESLGYAATAMTEWHDLACFQPNEVRLFLVTGMEVELQKLRAFKDLISAREAAQQAYTNAWHQLDRAEFQQKKHRDAVSGCAIHLFTWCPSSLTTIPLAPQGKADKVAKLDVTIAGHQKTVQAAKGALL